MILQKIGDEGMSAKHEGEWQEERNAFGGVQRYRIIGNVKEYEPELLTSSGISVPQSELEDYRRCNEKAIAAQKESEKNRPPQRDCPFRDGITTHCKQDECALYYNGCTLARLNDRPPIKDTKGLKCPFNQYTCRPECALYLSGCKLTGIKK